MTGLGFELVEMGIGFGGTVSFTIMLVSMAIGLGELGLVS
jgi:hypothetical protein